MIGAGALRDRVRFDRRSADANGDLLGPWVEGQPMAALIDYQRGSESAVSMRLEGRQPISVTVRDSSASRAIGPAMRMVNVRTAAEYNVTAASPARDPGFINIQAISGVAPG